MIERDAKSTAQASAHEGDMDGHIALVDAQDFGCVSWVPPPVCVGDHISQRPLSRWTVMFMGSIVA